MKKLSYLFSAAVLALLLVSVGCDSGGDDGTPAVDQVGNNFTGTWGVDATAANSVTFGTEDRTSDYANFTLTVTYVAGSEGGTAVISGGPTGLRPFGTENDWTFSPVPTDGATTNFNIIRTTDGANITVSNFSTAGLTLSFTLASGGSVSRTEAVEGNWNFNLVKQ